MKVSRLALALAVCACSGIRAQAPPEAEPLPPAKTSWSDRIWFGGSVGASFGDVDYLQVSPAVGVHLTPRFSTGIGVSWIHRDYSGIPELTTDDVGIDVLGRYEVFPQVFAQVQYSYTEFEYPLVAGGTLDDSYSTVLVGGGWAQPLGRGASFVMSALYDVTYDDDEPAPYDDPWVVSAGVVFGF